MLPTSFTEYSGERFAILTVNLPAFGSTRDVSKDQFDVTSTGVIVEFLE